MSFRAIRCVRARFLPVKKEGMTVKYRLAAALMTCTLLLAGCGRRADSEAPTVPTGTGTAVSQTAEPETTDSRPSDTQTTGARTTAGSETARTRTAGTTTASSAASGSGTQSAQTTAQQTGPSDKKLAAAKEKCDRLLKALQTAQSDAKAVQQSLTAALDQQRAAEQAYQSYRNEHQSDLDRYGQGSLGFFSFVGAEDAVKVLKTAKYASSTKPGEESDATSLTNMAKSFDLMRECNQLRAKNGLKPLVVTDRLMAIAQSNLNWSDGHIDHSRQFNVGENLSWNYGDPFDGWYEAEKATNGGHYLNIINKDYLTTGFAVCTAGRSKKYTVSHGQVFSFSAEQTFTVDQYEKRFRSYSGSISAIQKEMETRRKAAEAKKKQAASLSASLKQKQQAIEQAETAYQQALAACETLGAGR